jgi:hypothetical protein
MKFYVIFIPTALFRMNSEQGCRDKKHVRFCMTSPLPIDTSLQAPLSSFSHAGNVWYAPWGMCNVWIVLHVCSMKRMVSWEAGTTKFWVTVEFLREFCTSPQRHKCDANTSPWHALPYPRLLSTAIANNVDLQLPSIWSEVHAIMLFCFFRMVSK